MLRMHIAMSAIMFGAVPAAMAQRPPQTLSVAEEVVIDASAHDLTQISWLVVSRGGTVGVGQSQDHRVLLFGSRGETAGSVGRAGEGPGEFRTLARLGWNGDTLVAFDAALRRATTFSVTGRVITTVTVPSLTDAGGAGVGSVGGVHLFSDSTFLATVVLRRGAVPTWMPAGSQGMPLVLISPGGALKRVVAVVPSMECSVGVKGENGNASLGVPYCAQSAWSVTSDGARIVVATPQMSAAGRASVNVKSVPVRGGGALSFEVPIALQQIPSRIIDSVRQGRIAQVPSPAMKQAFREMEFPKVYPPFRSVLASNDGSTWIEAWPTPAGRRWLRLSSIGQITATLSLPENVFPRSIEGGVMWATRSDADGVQSAVRYRLQP